MNRSASYRVARAAAIPVAVLALLAGCASNEKVPTPELAVARTAVDEAQRAGAREFAPLALQSAEDKLARARAAVDTEDYVLAQRLAVEAEADANLAQARAQSVRSKRAAAEVRQSIQVLRQELDSGRKTQ